MPEQVKGFLAKDGKFFDSYAFCEEYEARKELEDAVDNSIYQGASLFSSTFVQVVELLRPTISRFIAATEVLQKQTPTVVAEPVVVIDVVEDKADECNQEQTTP